MHSEQVICSTTSVSVDSSIVRIIQDAFVSYRTDAPRYAMRKPLKATILSPSQERREAQEFPQRSSSLISWMSSLVLGSCEFGFADTKCSVPAIPPFNDCLKLSPRDVNVPSAASVR